jgi:hypothetical protein
MPAELIAFPERNYESTILVSIFRAGKMGNANFKIQWGIQVNLTVNDSGFTGDIYCIVV